jgi:hypothetical protein
MISMSSGEWLVPFKGRNHSGWYDQNFLWRYKNLYVMDNHRAAFWCWLQHIDPHQPHALFHIDRHYDTLGSRLDTWLKHLPASLYISIDDYLAHSYEDESGLGSIPVFAWGNYLSIYLALFGKSVTLSRWATHRDGDKPNHARMMEMELWEIPENMDYWLDPESKPWIMNIDLDYFFWNDSEAPGLMVSDAYLERCFEPIRKKMDDGTIGVTTICLTPDEGFTGGWQPSEMLAKRVLEILGVDFVLK